VNIEFVLGLLTLVGRGPALVMGLIVLRLQVRELRKYKNLQFTRWALLIINAALILLYMAPIPLGIERVSTGVSSDVTKIVVSAMVSLMLLIISGFFLFIYKRKNDD
jgi:hypothetical protein